VGIVTINPIEDIIIGQSAPAKELKKLIGVVADAPTSVLVLGETGTGKELVARAIHAASGRGGKLVSVNCAAIPSELLESEIFGHEKGAFTGADKPREGRVELARGGTLFLDEIGDMPLPLQTKLLRVLENRTVQRVGGNDEIEVDFRLVCATHQDIQARVDDGAFRADLYYRINVFPIQVPSLAERQVDIPLIASAILEQLADGHVGGTPAMDQSAMTELSRYPWPGNVRELRNVLERALVMFPQQAVTGTQVRENLLRMKAPDRSEEMDALWEASQGLSGIDLAQEAGEPPLPHPAHYADWFSYFDNIDLRRHLRDIEVVLIEAALEKSDGMVSQAAETLKLRRTTLIEKMKKLMIERPPSAKEG
jgi:sigma-54 specific flagellar transcriptional regulator A